MRQVAAMSTRRRRGLLGRRITIAAIGAIAFPLAAAAADNGTDPTKMRRLLSTSWEHMDLQPGVTRQQFEFIYDQPLGDHTGLRVSLPLARLDVPSFADDYGLADLSIRLTHVPIVTRSHGLVLQIEAIVDTAQRPELGADATSLKGGVIYAMFLEGGAIFAPALAHTQSIAGAGEVNETVLDLYYVPRMSDPAYYLTIDPAIVSNWADGGVYSSLSATFGRSIGVVGAGMAQIYIKPNVFIGGDRPADWAVEIGFRIIGF